MGRVETTIVSLYSSVGGFLQIDDDDDDDDGDDDDDDDDDDDRWWWYVLSIVKLSLDLSILIIKKNCCHYNDTYNH